MTTKMGRSSEVLRNVVVLSVRLLRDKGWTAPANVVERVLADLGVVAGKREICRSLAVHMVRPAPHGFRRDLATWSVFA